MSIVDESGRNLSTGEPLPFDWRAVALPREAYEFRAIMRDGEDPRPHGFPSDGLVRFPGEPAQFLYTAGGLPRGGPPGFPGLLPGGPPGGPPGFGPRGGPAGPGGRGGPPPPIYRWVFFSFTFGFLALSVLTGVGVALKLIYRSIHEKALLADSVIAELQAGNLKARFPVERSDEVGEAMLRFNRMAEEIERLVERLRSVEKSRITLLQDLTHDLRTPVASLKNLLVTVEKKSATEDQPLRLELLSLAQREVEYFERLVEDLLTLAQVSEPRYQAAQESVSVLDILDDEIETVAAAGPPGEAPKDIDLIAGLRAEYCFVRGDLRLLRRLFRNALENAHSFARTRVTVEVESDSSGELTVVIRDDGPGLSESALKGFGERRVSRVLDRAQGHRLSVGLGSVIMKTVVEIHRGRLSATNLTLADGKIGGAEIRISLPRADYVPNMAKKV
jgi:signal transduction histidine kinase